MLGQHAGCQRDSFLRIDRAVGPNLKRQLVVVDGLRNAGAGDIVIHLEHRGVNAIHGKSVDIILLNDSLLIALCGHIAAAFVEGELHDELAALAQAGDMPLRVQDLDVIALLDVVGRDFTRANSLHTHRLRPVGVQLCSNPLQVQDNFGNVFLDALNGGELVNHAVDLDAGHGDTGQRGKKHTTQAVAQCDAKTTLQRLCHELAVAAVGRQACRFDFGTFNLHHIYALLVKPMLPSAHSSILFSRI